MNFQTSDILHNTINGIPQNEISSMINLVLSKKNKDSNEIISQPKKE